LFLEVFILKGLRAYFSEVRILKGLAGTRRNESKDPPLQEDKSGWAEAQHLQRQGEALNAETHGAQRIGKEGTGIEVGGGSRRVLRGWEWRPNMWNDSRILATCQTLYLSYCIVIRTARRVRMDGAEVAG